MKRRFVRPDDVLEDDEEVVLRGGLLDPGVVRRDAQRMFDIYGAYGISVFGLRGATIDELAQRVPLIRFSRLTLVTVGALRRVGLSLEPTGRNPRHYTVIMPSLEEGVLALRECEQRVWRNPYHEG